MEIIVRDRSPEYARGATMGAPAALQVVDRWHVLKNVREVAERLLDRHRQDLREVKVDTAGTRPRRRSAAEEARRTSLRLRAAEIHAEVHRRAADGGTISGIARDLGVTRTMARRYLFADAPPEREYAQRPSGLDPYAAYLRRRWAEDRRERDPLAPTMDRPRKIPRPLKLEA